mmetsp:Transcript_28722/g.43380  ORF Transcript_28722/g.43380 Transcript_28722/m.43380 type:complete len:92 (-) Transcript_28722:1616-1891(-)
MCLSVIEHFLDASLKLRELLSQVSLAPVDNLEHLLEIYLLVYCRLQVLADVVHLLKAAPIGQIFPDFLNAAVDADQLFLGLLLLLFKYLSD